MALVAIAETSAFTSRWWLAALCLLVSYFSMASGALTTAAAFAICALQVLLGRRSGRSEWLALAVLFAMTVIMVLFIPVLAHHAPLKAHSIWQFISALVHIMSWLLGPSQPGIVASIAGAFAIQAPALLTSLYVIWLRPPIADRRWLLVTLTGATVLQAAAVAYGRATAPLSSRYLDLFAISLPLNFACLLYLLDALRHSGRGRRLVAAAMAFWLLLVLVGVTTTTIQRSLPELAEKRAVGRAETENLRAYLATNDIRTLQNKPRLDIPYPDANRLAMIVSQPVIRAILPPELVGEASARRAQQRGLARFTGRPVEALKDFALHWGVLLIPAGLALFLCGLMTQAWRRPEIVPPRE